EVYRVSPLPIELIGFEARAAADQVDLHWSTASELNNAYFSVERSQDNDAWSTVATVPGQENSQSVIAYSSVDDDPPLGHIYYRLRQTDLNGTSTCSMVKVVYMAAASAPQLWPNPATDRMHVAGTDLPALVDVMDAQGRRITLPVQPSPDGPSVDVSALPPGRYVMVLGDAGQHATFIHQ
ncbi:MAG TPA: T9SS type A sorting domain-containing protein, partial [Flavobacteriales bacterium]